MQFYDLYNEGRDIDSVLKDLVGIALTSDESNKVIGFQPKGDNRIGHFNLTNGGGGGTVDADEDEIILGNGIGETPKGAETFLKKYEFPLGNSEDEVDLNFYFSGEFPPPSGTYTFNLTLIDSSHQGTNLFDFLSTDYTTTNIIVNGQELERSYSSYFYSLDGLHQLTLSLPSKKFRYYYSQNTTNGNDTDFYTYNFVWTLKISRTEAENLLNFSEISVQTDATYPTTLAISVGNIFIIQPRTFYPMSSISVDIVKENMGCTITDSQKISDVLYYNSDNALSPFLNLQANSALSVGKLSRGLIGNQSLFQVDDYSLFEIKERSRFSQYGNSRVKIGNKGSAADTRLIIENGAKVDITGIPNYKAPQVFIHNNTEINIDSGQNLTGDSINIGIDQFPYPLKQNEDYGSKIRIHDSAKVEMDHEAYLQMHDTSSIVMTSSSNILMHETSLVSLNGDSFIQMDGKIGMSPTLDLSGGCNIVGNGSINVGDNHPKAVSCGPTFLMNPNSFYVHTQNKSGPSQNGKENSDFIKALRRIYQKTEESELHLVHKSDAGGLYVPLLQMYFNLSKQAHQFRDFSIETKQALLSKIKELINNGDTTIDDVNEYLEEKKFYAYIFQDGVFKRIKNFNLLRTYSETEASLRALIFDPSMYHPFYSFIQTIDPTYTLEIEIIGRYYRNTSDVDQYDYYPIAAALDDLDMTVLPSTCYLGNYVIMEKEFFDEYYANYFHLFFSNVDETGHLDPEGQYCALKDAFLKRNKTEVDGKITGVSLNNSFLYMAAYLILRNSPACYYQSGLSTVIVGGDTIRDGDENNPDIRIGAITLPGDTYVRIGANAGRKVETYILNNSHVEVNDDSVIYVNGNVNNAMQPISTPENGSVLQLFNNSYFAMLGYDTINDSTKLARIVPSDDALGSPIFLMTGNSKLSLDKTARLVLDNGSGIESTMDETTHTVSYDFSFGFNSGDKVTITKEDFEKLSTMPNFWFGTEAEYDALGTYDTHTIYMIEED